VMYDEQRGEPRKGSEPAGTEAGDCVNCYRCVAVCPTGIDIRRGIQLECVACTACIDACDEIMDKVGNPRGLIRYSSEEAMAGGVTRRMRPASIAYGAVLGALLIAFSVSVAARHTLDVEFIRAIGAPYTTNTMDDGSVQVINHYRAIIKNNGFHALTVTLAIDNTDAPVELVAPTYPVHLQGGQNDRSHIFFKFPGTLTDKTGKYAIRMRVHSKGADGGEEVVVENVTLVGPFQ
jgi:cytochrome c oxidase accessory protein FixG